VGAFVADVVAPLLQELDEFGFDMKATMVAANGNPHGVTLLMAV
jgi:hypothetical protein